MVSFRARRSPLRSLSVHRSVVKESDTTSWSMIDPDDLLESSPNYKECLERFPLARKAAPLTLYCQVTGKSART